VLPTTVRRAGIGRTAQRAAVEVQQLAVEHRRPADLAGGWRFTRVHGGLELIESGRRRTEAIVDNALFALEFVQEAHHIPLSCPDQTAPPAAQRLGAAVLSVRMRHVAASTYQHLLTASKRP
jgi:hypothetical protein